MFFFLKIPAVWCRYASMRRDVELFILNYKNAKERSQFEAIIQILPDSVIVVGPSPQGALDSIKPSELSNGEESVANSGRHLLEENKDSFEEYIDEIKFQYKQREASDLVI